VVTAVWLAAQVGGMSVPSHIATFLQEAEDLLERAEAAMLSLDADPDDAGLIDQLFRALHTLKGAAGMVGFSRVASFTHHLETALDQVRSGEVALAPEMVGVLLAGKDYIQEVIAAEIRGEAPDASVGDTLIAQLEASTGGPRAVVAPAMRMRTSFEVFFETGPGFADTGVAPEALIDDLRQLGAVAVLSAPAPGSAAPAWTLEVTTESDENAIRDAFIFVAGAVELRIERGLSEFLFDDEPAAAAPVPAAPVASDVVGVIGDDEPAALAVAPVRAAPTGPAVASPSSTPASPTPTAGAATTVRVSTDRLDQLVKLVGELVINQSRLQQAFVEDSSADMAGPVEAMERLIAELRDSVLGIRMMPIGTTFNRYQRLVRDLSVELDKEIDLVTTGAETELDKTVLDQLGDPLVHILRNSMDHGIEAPDERERKGKPRRGTVRLSASHEGAHVVITIADDGKGLDKAAIRAKAEEKGLVAPGQILTEQETFDLILRPGFSTAKAITQLSGRGVGMDVVKKTIEHLRGSLTVSSPPTGGTVIRLRLPLTLAIIDGLLVDVDGDRFIVPMSAVHENLELQRHERQANNGRNVVAVRGDLVPYVRLRELFSVHGAEHDIEKVVIVGVDGQRVGLVVDRVIGSHQTVIQPMGPFYRDIDLFSGTTIMGDGRVAMILDLAGTVRHAAAAAAIAAAASLN
jgi:two-component system chemotaxis sensor kinase CheA